MIDWTLQVKKIKDLRPNAYNPRSLSKRSAQQLEKSLERFGLIDKPIVTEEGEIVGGHQRIALLKRKGIKEVECWVPSRELSKKEIDELCIRLNRNTGDWDYDMLANIFETPDLIDWGFTLEDLGIDEEEKKPKKEKYVISLEFSDKDTFTAYQSRCEEIADQASAKIKIRGSK
jgi:ParB-like chromosome segregation protein Spo0J